MMDIPEEYIESGDPGDPGSAVVLKSGAFAKLQNSITSNYTQEQIELLKRTVARGATDDEFLMFMAVARQSGLDPFTKQIHFVKRRVWDRLQNAWCEVGTVQVGIDGYRGIAERSGQLAGIDDVIYDDESGPNPGKATVTVYRLVGGMRAPFTATARWREYAQATKDGKLTGQWPKMPYLMLGKCAESLALRKAFPLDLSGIRTDEEMSCADVDDSERATADFPTWGGGETTKQIEAPPVGGRMEEAHLDAYLNAISEADAEKAEEIAARGLAEAQEVLDRGAYRLIRRAMRQRLDDLGGKGNGVG